MRFTIGRPAFSIGLALSALLVAPPLVAQQGEVTGRVTDKASAQGLGNAQVSIVGTTLRALTGQDGRYRLVNVPAGQATVRVAFIGYGTTTQPVTVPPSGSVETNVAPSPVAIRPGAIGITPPGNQAQREPRTVAHKLD